MFGAYTEEEIETCFTIGFTFTAIDTSLANGKKILGRMGTIQPPLFRYLLDAVCFSLLISHMDCYILRFNDPTAESPSAEAGKGYLLAVGFSGHL